MNQSWLSIGEVSVYVMLLGHLLSPKCLFIIRPSIHSLWLVYKQQTFQTQHHLPFLFFHIFDSLTSPASPSFSVLLTPSDFGRWPSIISNRKDVMCCVSLQTWEFANILSLRMCSVGTWTVLKCKEGWRGVSIGFQMAFCGAQRAEPCLCFDGYQEPTCWCSLSRIVHSLCGLTASVSENHIQLC